MNANMNKIKNKTYLNEKKFRSEELKKIMKIEIK